MGAISSSPATSSATSGTIAVGAAVAAAVAVSMSAYVRFEIPDALDAHGETALLAWVLVAAAGLGALLCAYLALIWSMTSLVLLVGPASRIGRAIVSALRVIAPRVARRLTLGAAVATTATGLALAPAAAADQASDPDQQGPGQISIAATLTSTAPLPTGGNDAAQSEGGGDGSTSQKPGTEPDERDTAPDERGAGRGEPVPETGTDAAPRPGLGWSDAPRPGSDAAADEGRAAAPDAAAPEANSAPQSSPQSPFTVDVQPGDSLWSITDDLLGSDADQPDDISALWPSLHAANSDVIGPDPDHLEPGQVLVVPADLSPQEQP